MQVGIVKETLSGESRVCVVPATVKKLIKLGLKVVVEKEAGKAAGYPDADYEAAGASVVGSKQEALKSEIVLKIHRPLHEDLSLMKEKTLLVCMLDPFNAEDYLKELAQRRLSAICLEKIPRTSRAQSMDILSSQANIAGYRCVLEAANQYKRFFPMMMTSAGMAKPAKALVLGVGVAGLQAISTLKRLGASVEAFDVRPEVREQIISVGAKPLDLDLGEEGAGEGGYAKELSEEAKRRQQVALTDKIKKMDIVVTTANVPGRKAPTLITEEAVIGMREGSVIVDLAAPSGGNCPLTVQNQIVEKKGVTIIGLTNYSSLLAADSSLFFGNNLAQLLALFIKTEDNQTRLHYDLEDDIVAATLLVKEGEVRNV